MSELFPPVTTESAEKVRLGALTVLGDRFLLLKDRSQRRSLTSLERSEIDWIAKDLRLLQGMAPIGELQPARISGALALRA